MKRLLPHAFYAFLAVVVTAIVFNVYALEIFKFNAQVRSWVVGNGGERQSFSPDGIPYSTTPRHDERFVSPFYVVHYGLIHSEHCRARAPEGAYHWTEDQTVQDWPQPPKSSLAMFRSSADWVVRNTRRDDLGNAHLFYDFDWPYANYPGGRLNAPWWSGLTDGHALTLLLRAEDCFADPRYRETAAALYRSTVAPVDQGGSLLSFNGRPWVEEYVDPRVDPAGMSRVLNGMAYAYFGVKAFEEAENVDGIADDLRQSIIHNIGAFDLGYWSSYDAIGSSANIKYHNVNLALLKDRRLYSPEFDDQIERWSVGSALPGLFYVLQGPPSIAKWHFIVSWALAVLLAWVAIFGLVIAAGGGIRVSSLRPFSAKGQ